MTQNKQDLASRLSKRVAIEQPLETADGAGGKTISWATFATVWAEILPRSGREEIFADQIRNRVSHKISIRYLVGLNEKMRVSYNARLFNITALVNVNEANEIIEIYADEGVVQ